MLHLCISFRVIAFGCIRKYIVSSVYLDGYLIQV